MPGRVDDFVARPTVDLLGLCTKEELSGIAEHYGVRLAPSMKKQQQRLALVEALTAKEVMECSVGKPEEEEVVTCDPVSENQVLLRKMELEFKFEQLRHAEREAERGRVHELELGRLGVEARAVHLEARFDVTRHLRLVPQFSEKDVDKYFSMFENIATTLKWPNDQWTLLLQSALTGKAQHVYASLCPNTQDYAVVKAAILRAYELVPEAYRQRFRALRKKNVQTYVEFAYEKELLFDRWCASEKVDTLVRMRELVLLEEFKSYCLPDNVAMYINEHKVTECSVAASLADEFVLTHKVLFDRPNYPVRSVKSRPRWGLGDGPVASGGGSVGEVAERGMRGEMRECFHYGKKGHIKEKDREKKKEKGKECNNHKLPPVHDIARENGEVISPEKESNEKPKAVSDEELLLKKLKKKKKKKHKDGERVKERHSRPKMYHRSSQTVCSGGSLSPPEFLGRINGNSSSSLLHNTTAPHPHPDPATSASISSMVRDRASCHTKTENGDVKMLQRDHNAKEKVGDLDYLIETPDRGRKTRLCHVNMIKPYYVREPLVNPIDSIIVSCFPLLFMFIPPFRLGVMDIKLGVGVLCVCALIRRS